MRIQIKALRSEEIEDKEGEVINSDAYIVSRWLEEGVFEAMEMKCLKTVMFGIYELTPTDSKKVLSCQFTLLAGIHFR